MANTQNFVPMVGVDMLHYAKVSTDSTGNYSVDKIKKVPGTTESGFNMNGQISTFYADNGAYDTATAVGDFDVSIACADVTPEMQSDMYGFDYNEETGELSGSDINAPYVAVLYRIQKSNGAYRYVKIFKAKAVPNEEKAQTKGGSINFQTNGFTLKAAKRLKDGLYFRKLDSDDPKLPEGVTNETIEANWFTDIDWSPAAE